MLRILWHRWIHLCNLWLIQYKTDCLNICAQQRYVSSVSNLGLLKHHIIKWMSETKIYIQTTSLTAPQSNFDLYRG